MARRTANWWPLTFDISRSQSGLRVAATAAPVTALEPEQSLVETLAGDVVMEEGAARRAGIDGPAAGQHGFTPEPPQASGLGNLWE
ncbi:hypothetical protein HYH03_008657 [Edaphochlamys debaryana]|uniref:Uncharacterized protein n=1 Tax=Edaphochlamys debaryana TaxID=47281 RepID=A0A836BXX8_9CHLO|nr:hypothetical protein HYH03_008657 [Edaphochlamys debaryana]|eukprot:KAG2493241.1 hypothetical protein HYH03_008657 [Edaphochlamys debaryana]